MIIRNYDVSDIDKINELGRNLHDNYKFSLDVFSHCLVCEEDKKIIGFSTYSTIYERAEIIDIYVDEKYRNKDYGSKLLTAIVSWCKKKACINITLEVNQSNHVAIAFYRKHGFIIVANKIGYYNGGKDDAYVMELELR